MNGTDFLHSAAELVRQYRASIREDFAAMDPDRIWERPVPDQVSPANLMLHLSGNLRHFFGHMLSGTDYVRDRDREFVAEPYADHTEILAEWDTACSEVLATFEGLAPAKLDEPAPFDRYPGGGPVHLMTVRLLGHLGYHAGQLRTHRKFLEKG